jgi:hypothetical protein
MDIMNDIAQLPKSSKVILDTEKNRHTLFYNRGVRAVEQWEKVLLGISISKGSLTRHREGLALTCGESTEGDILLEIHMDLDPSGTSDEANYLAARFKSDGTADFMESFSDDVIRKRYGKFFGFTGTWEDTARKMFELNDFVAANNS